jgi:hypothetical protein
MTTINGKMTIRILRFLLLLSSLQSATAQTSRDTTAVIKEFNEVMAFAVQPYLHYSNILSFRSGPLINLADTGQTLHGSFYKDGDDLYYGNEQEETFWQDSLMIHVDHHRKMIQVSKVDIASKKNMDILPLKKMDKQRLLRSHYTIARLPEQGDTEYIVIRSQEGKIPIGAAATEMLLAYTRQGHLPLLMKVTMRLRQPASGQAEEVLQSKGFDVSKMREEKDGQSVLVMTQTASVQFKAIEM